MEVNDNDAKVRGQDEPEVLKTPMLNNLKNDDYENWTKEDLIEKIRKLTCHVKQLRNVIRRDDQNQSTDEKDGRPMKKARRNRPFDFSKHPKRHVALKITYLGWDYQGLAVQEDTDNTIEAHLFDALIKAKLIDERSTSNYHRCGRTDKGVSAFCQVISIDLRCKCNVGKGVIISHCDEETIKNTGEISSLDKEIEYCKILNAILPKEIRVLAWAPVKQDFSSRFDCKERVYKYFIPIGNANVKAIEEAGQYLLGEHNFQNFCKADTSADRTMIRRIISVNISKCESSWNEKMEQEKSDLDPYSIFEVEIRGQSFLWHQIRCITAVLILVGQGREKPEIVKNFLDLDKFPQKPQYSMAMDYPLVLFDTHHGDEISEWIYSPENISHVVGDLQTIWSHHALRATMVLKMIKNLEYSMKKITVNDSGVQISKTPGTETEIKWFPSAKELPLICPNQHLDCLVMGTKTKVYKSLGERPVCAGSNSNSNTNINKKVNAKK